MKRFCDKRYTEKNNLDLNENWKEIAKEKIRMYKKLHYYVSKYILKDLF